jgi:hypothetical protein
MQLAQLLSEGHYDSLKVVDDVNIVADIIKKFFNSLRTPIINFSLYDCIMKTIPSILNVVSKRFKRTEHPRIHLDGYGLDAEPEPPRAFGHAKFFAQHHPIRGNKQDDLLQHLGGLCAMHDVATQPHHCRGAQYRTLH